MFNHYTNHFYDHKQFEEHFPCILGNYFLNLHNFLEDHFLITVMKIKFCFCSNDRIYYPNL